MLPGVRCLLHSPWVPGRAIDNISLVSYNILKKNRKNGKVNEKPQKSKGFLNSMASLSGARIVKEVPGGVSLDASVRKGWNKLNLRLTTRFRTSLCVHCDHQTREKMDRKHTCRYENMPFHGPTREEVKDLKMANIKEPVTLHALEEQHKARLEQSRSVSLVKSHLRCGYCTLCKYGVAHLSESP